MESEDANKRQEDFSDTCRRCKTNYSCCHETLPPITEERKRIIEVYMKEYEISVVDPFCKMEYIFPRVDAGGYCIFHDKTTKKCVIHPVKPETCVSGPITFDINKKTGNIEWFIKMEKICPLAGVVYRNKKQLRLHLNSAKREIKRLAQELDSRALVAVLTKDEPETFKIDEETVGKDVLQKILRF